MIEDRFLLDAMSQHKMLTESDRKALCYLGSHSDVHQIFRLTALDKPQSMPAPVLIVSV